MLTLTLQRSVSLFCVISLICDKVLEKAARTWSLGYYKSGFLHTFLGNLCSLFFKGMVNRNRSFLIQFFFKLSSLRVKSIITPQESEMLSMKTWAYLLISRVKPAALLGPQFLFGLLFDWLFHSTCHPSLSDAAFNSKSEVRISFMGAAIVVWCQTPASLWCRGGGIHPEFNRRNSEWISAVLLLVGGRNILTSSLSGRQHNRNW